MRTGPDRSGADRTGVDRSGPEWTGTVTGPSTEVAIGLRTAATP